MLEYTQKDIAARMETPGRAFFSALRYFQRNEDRFGFRKLRVAKNKRVIVYPARKVDRILQKLGFR